MHNRVIITILVLLVIIAGGTGYYAYNLSRQIDDLSYRLASSENAQTARANAILGELTTLGAETGLRFSVLEGGLADTRSELDTQFGAAQQQIGSLEATTANITAQVVQLEAGLDEAVEGFSRAGIDAVAVYDKISPATVRISNGSATLGSGFIYNSGRYVLTANHVVDGMQEIYVVLHDGRVLRATEIGSSEAADIAVLRTAKDTGIAPLEMADSSQVRIGEAVVALGNPGFAEGNGELRYTLSSGIVSHVNRFVNVDGRSVANLIQSDVAVNPGNSGCPLANSRGEIVGVIIARVNADVGDGIAYAVASNKAKRVADTLISQGFYDYPWVGIGVADITPEIALDMDLPDTNGVLVTQVFIDSPAREAGIRIDDVVIAMDGVATRNTSELTSYLGEFKGPGDASVITVRRGNATEELEIVIGTLE